MEEVDGIIIHSLRQCGVDIAEEVNSLREFTAELTVEGVVRCLRSIDPALGNAIATTLPPGMSARFRAGTRLAQACQDLGYSREVGYQTFLYGSEVETRNLLMFLVERLPRETIDSGSRPAGKLAVLQASIAARIREELSAPWVPPFCRPLLNSWQRPGLACPFRTVPLSVPGDVTDPMVHSTPEERRYWEGHLKLAACQVTGVGSLIMSILQRNANEVAAATAWETEWNTHGLPSHLSADEFQARKKERFQKRVVEQMRLAVAKANQMTVQQQGLVHEDLQQILRSFGTESGSEESLKGSRFTHTEKLVFQKEPDKQKRQLPRPSEPVTTSKEEQQAAENQREEEVAELRQKLDELTMKAESLREDSKRLQAGVAQLSQEVGESEEQLAEQREVARVRQRTLSLLPDAGHSIAKLQAMVEASVQRIANLSRQWEGHRAPLLQMIRELRQLQLNQEEKLAWKMTHLREVRDKRRRIAVDVQAKEELQRQLISEYEGTAQDVSRSAYTQRILEIVGNIKKQKEEIGKILLDTRDVQKEINGLSGKLERTFAVAEDLIFKDAKKDETARKVYKHLAALHENCGQLIDTIEDTGAVMREIRDLEEQMEAERGREAVTNLEKIAGDFRAIRQENGLLASRLKDS
uniref:coiled-coil domain-containing protein 22 isoform X2 n=1 Tax=Myxine glutinosa TaxID=7769 RepID=UPI00358DFEA0